MNYDQWKTMSDRDERSDEVTSCCGVEQESSGASNCCDAKLYPNSDICTRCKEHADEYMKCSECGDDETYYTMISQFEYDERKREDAAEMYRDDY